LREGDKYERIAEEDVEWERYVRNILFGGNKEHPFFRLFSGFSR
jgi:hypothetical protein